MVFGAGSETTAGSIAMTIAALAVDGESMDMLHKVRSAATGWRCDQCTNTRPCAAVCMIVRHAMGVMQ